MEYTEFGISNDLNKEGCILTFLVWICESDFSFGPHWMKFFFY